MRLHHGPSRPIRFLALGAALLAAACAISNDPRRIALFTSLPILWPETGSLGELLSTGTRRHWALAVLQRDGAVAPLDSLLAGPGGPALRGFGKLVMAQPRPLAPEENVALDRWVRGGGRLLLFADPMLTAQSGFALGDRRRPEAIAMLSPILSRWGLRLEFDEDQPAGERYDEVLGAALPVNLAGRFAAVGKTCALLAGGLAAQCRIGRGRALIIADAALLEPGSPQDLAERRAALERLLDALGTD